MKRTIATIIALALLLMVSVGAYATESQITLTTVVLSATYTLNIPESTEIIYGTAKTKLGTLTVTNSAHFSEEKCVKVRITYDALKCDGVDTTIPYTISAYASFTDGSSCETKYLSGQNFVFKGTSSGSCEEQFVLHINDSIVKEKYLVVNIAEAAWQKALAGDYSSTITFTAYVSNVDE